MRIFGKKIHPVSYINLWIVKIDVRWFFVWIDTLEKIAYRRNRNVKLKIDSVKHKAGDKWQK
jgi:hypothetical protein